VAFCNSCRRKRKEEEEMQVSKREEGFNDGGGGERDWERWSRKSVGLLFRSHRQVKGK